MADFRKHLTARLGANLEDSTADQYVRNVPKVLYFINPDNIALMDLLQTRKISDYLDALKDCGLGGYGQRARVDACFQALVYLKTEINGVNIADVDRALAKLTMYRTRLRRRQPKTGCDERRRQE